MSQVTCEAYSNQLFTVLAYSPTGELLGPVTQGAMLSGALACARAYNANDDGRVAVVVPAEAETAVDSDLPTLELSDFCQSRDEETEITHTVWDWCATGDYVEMVDTIALDSACATFIRFHLTSAGHTLPERNSDDEDMAELCAMLPVVDQLAIWNRLREHF